MTRLYQLALRAFPRRHRDLYGVEMLDAFDRELAARTGRARLGRRVGGHATENPGKPRTAARAAGSPLFT